MFTTLLDDIKAISQLKGAELISAVETAYVENEATVYPDLSQVIEFVGAAALSPYHSTALLLKATLEQEILASGIEKESQGKLSEILRTNGKRIQAVEDSILQSERLQQISTMLYRNFQSTFEAHYSAETLWIFVQEFMFDSVYRFGVLSSELADFIESQAEKLNDAKMSSRGSEKIRKEAELRGLESELEDLSSQIEKNRLFNKNVEMQFRLHFSELIERIEEFEFEKLYLDARIKAKKKNPKISKEAADDEALQDEAVLAKIQARKMADLELASYQENLHLRHKSAEASSGIGTDETVEYKKKIRRLYLKISKLSHPDKVEAFKDMLTDEQLLALKEFFMDAKAISMDEFGDSERSIVKLEIILNNISNAYQSLGLDLNEMEPEKGQTISEIIAYLDKQIKWHKMLIEEAMDEILILKKDPVIQDYCNCLNFEDDTRHQLNQKIEKMNDQIKELKAEYDALFG
jgi:hypothetical protein